MRIAYFIPIALFLGLTSFLAVGLYLGDPSEIPSVFIDEPAPPMDLTPVPGYREGATGLTNAMLEQGQPSIVNVWASWCAPCRVEHPFLMLLAETADVPLYGLNYKDEAVDAKRFLDELGDPYDAIGHDFTGRTGIDWGVYGVPETFVIDGRGRIVLKHVGPINQHTIKTKIYPALDKAREVSVAEPE